MLSRKRRRRESVGNFDLQGTLTAQAFRNEDDISFSRTISGEIVTLPSVINKLRTISKRAGDNFKADVIGMGTLLNNEDEAAWNTVEMKVELAISKIKSESDQSVKTEFTWLYIGSLHFDKKFLEDLGGGGSIKIRGEFNFHLVDRQHVELESAFPGNGMFLDKR